MDPLSTCLALMLSLALDWLVGNPAVRMAPARALGRWLAWVGMRIAPRAAADDPQRTDWRAFAAGALAWYAGAVLLLVPAVLLQRLLAVMPMPLAAALAALLVWPLLAWRGPGRDALALEAALSRSLAAGRQALARQWPHPVMTLDATQVREAGLQTLARRHADELVAPVLCFTVGGLPALLLLAYARAADAAWGHPGVRGGLYWRWTGRWAAGADRLLRWLPARVAGAVLLAVAGGRMPLAHTQREAQASGATTGGWPVAALALALQRRLGRPGGPVFNRDAGPVTAEDLPRAVVLTDWSLAVLLAGVGTTLLLMNALLTR